MKALIVDDNEGIQTLLRIVLTSAGAEVVLARTGEEALGLIPVERPDVVILDIQMPGIDGWETLAKIRSSSESSELPVVICSVRSGSRDVAEAWRIGCDGYVSKPFDIEELAKMVDGVVAATQEERLARRVKALREAERLVALER